VKLIVIGCGRVGSTIAKRFASEGWNVTAVDENESALSRLGENWTGGFVRGHGMDSAVLREAGIEDAVGLSRALAASRNRKIYVAGGLFLAIEYAVVARGGRVEDLNFF